MEQAAWRFTQVQISRAPADAGGRTVLEIERRRVAARRPQKGVVPFGQPLPPSSAVTAGRAAPAADGGIDDAMMAQNFADADESGRRAAPHRLRDRRRGGRAGTRRRTPDLVAAPPVADDFGYDVYEVLDDDAEGEGAEAAEASAAAGGGSPEAAGEELWWEHHLRSRLRASLEGAQRAAARASTPTRTDEHDYPEDEDDDSLDDGDDGYEGVRMRGPPGNHDWFC